MRRHMSFGALRSDEGSPLKSVPILSISSSMKTGLLVPACFIPCIILPGNAPTYVLRCPQIGRGVPPEIRSYLIYLVEHENRVVGSSLFYPLYYPARQCADICPSVP